MSKTTIPTGGITADAINGTLIADDAVSEEHLDATAITGTTALIISSIKVKYPINLLPVRKAFVAPILPEPISRMSFFKKNLVNKNPKGIEPIKYEIIPTDKYSIFIF